MSRADRERREGDEDAPPSPPSTRSGLLGHAARPGRTRAVLISTAAIVAASVTIYVQRWFVDEPLELTFLLGLALIVPLEQLRPRRRPGPLLRPAWKADLTHSLIDTVPAQILAYPALYAAAVVANSLVPAPVHAAVAGQSHVAQILEVFVILQAIGYWKHRLSHEIPWLWQLHKVHHAIPDLDWLSARREHPLGSAIGRVAQTAPLLLLGFDVTTVLLIDVVLSVHVILTHANVRWHCHWLGRIVVTPDYHHWHHSNDPAHYNTNYATFLPIFDVIFGTYRFPRGEYAGELGTDEVAPTTYLGQLLWPFQRSSGAPAEAPAGDTESDAEAVATAS